MKKIYFSIILIIFILASVSISAYALFSSTATVSGLTFSTGNANLQISLDGGNWGSSIEIPPAYTNMAPGFTNSQEFFLKNISLSTINLIVTVKLFDNSPIENIDAWPLIGDKIIVSLQRQLGDEWIDIVSGSLTEWKDSGFELDTLTLNDPKKYQMVVKLEDASENESGQALSGLSFQFLGTQQ